MTVAELKHNDGKWNEALVRAMFIRDDAEAILAIPESEEGLPDKLCWHFSKDGEFSVKSGYRLAMAASPIDRNRASSSSSEPTSAWWKTLWRLSIPPKVKIFIWRVCKGWIPVRTVLARRGITPDTCCPLCIGGPETITHSIWGCRWSQKVWDISSFGDLVSGFRGDDVISFFITAMENIEVSKLDFFLVLVWEVWNHMNNVSAGKNKWDPSELVEWAGGFLDEYRRANLLPPSALKERQRTPKTWQPPPPGIFDVCVDAAVGEGRFGTGCVLRDYRGWVVASEIMSKDVGFSPPLAEAYAILEGLRLAEEVGIDSIEVKSDCLAVVNAIMKNEAPSTELGTILESIKVRRTNFVNFNISFLPRSCNVAAHNMARYALKVNSTSRWLGLVPPCAMADVIKDQTC